MLAGPATEGVADDPEATEVLAEVVHARAAPPDAVRERVHLASLPMADAKENAALANAFQRRAAVVVQKSLAEGFGRAVGRLLADEQLAARLGDAAHARVRKEFLEPRHLAQWTDIIERLSAGR